VALSIAARITFSWRSLAISSAPQLVTLVALLLDPGINLGVEPGHDLPAKGDRARESTRGDQAIEVGLRNAEPGKDFRAADKAGRAGHGGLLSICSR
jgi:hypothetical protein